MTLSASNSSGVGVLLGAELQQEVAPLVERLLADRMASRLFAADPTLWGPEAAAEAATRLGWVHAASGNHELLAEIEALRATLTAQEIDRIVLCGMGGSSLAPEVITASEHRPLTVLDATHPDQVARALQGPLERTAIVVSSKSGSTVETASHRLVFERAFLDAGIDPAQRIIVVSDPGSPLSELAENSGYRLFHADPTVGGRYSALTAFGLVPSGLAGANVRTLLADAEQAQSMLAADSETNPAILLAAALVCRLPARNVLFLAGSTIPNTPGALADWIEQLVAESTGKQGVGVLPVALGPNAPEQVSGVTQGVLAWLPPSTQHPAPDQLRVTGPLGAQLLLWEAATALAGALMGINPFDQPDVEAAKVAARGFLDSLGDAAMPSLAPISSAVFLAEPATDAGSSSQAETEVGQVRRIEDLLGLITETIPEHGYLAVQAYLDREAETSAPALRDALVRKTQAPVTFGWGPRFLHSTGQIHKGGPATGVFLQLLDASVIRDASSLEQRDLIPGASYSFAQLIRAQAAGDAQVLAQHGLRVITLYLDTPSRGIQELLEDLGRA